MRFAGTAILFGLWTLFSTGCGDNVVYNPTTEPVSSNDQDGTGPSFQRPPSDDDFLVIGVNLNGFTRAYPIYIMRWKEVANEQFGDAHVAVAY